MQNHKKHKFEKSLEVVLIVGGNNNITHHMMYDTILERKCIYSNGRYMLSLYYIFEKDVYTIRHAMGAFGMAPTASGST